MAQNLVTVDPTTYRIYPRQAPLHGNLDGLDGHAPPAIGQPLGKMAQTSGDGTWELIDTPSVDPYTAAGAILGATKVNPTTATDRTAVNTATDYDAPTLAITFTAPDSGKVLVELDGTHLTSSTSVVYWMLRQSGAIVPGSAVAVDGSTTPGRRHASILVEGLTAGSSYTWTWAAQTLAGSVTSTLRVGGGDIPAAGVGGAATMIVRDAPF